MRRIIRAVVILSVSVILMAISTIVKPVPGLDMENYAPLVAFVFGLIICLVLAGLKENDCDPE